MPHPDPKLNQRNNPTQHESESEPSGDLLFEPKAAARNKSHKDDPSLSSDAPFEENNATDGDGQ